MKAISKKNQETIDTLDKAHKALPWYKKLFFPKAVRLALEEGYDTPEKITTICKTCLTRTWWFQRFFFNAFSDFFKSDLGQALQSLKEGQLSKTDGNIKTLIGHEEPMRACLALFKLDKELLNNANNLNIIAKHSNPENAAEALNILHKSTLLTDNPLGRANRDALSKHNEPTKLAEALKILHRDNLLTDNALGQANREALTKHNEPLRLTLALHMLHRNKLLTDDAFGQANRDALTKHNNPTQLAEALNMLHQDKLLTHGDFGQANREAVTQHDKPTRLAHALYILNILSLLTHDDLGQANREALLKHQDPDNLADALRFLKNMGLLSNDDAGKANRLAVIEHNSPLAVALAFYSLKQAGLLGNDIQGVTNRQLILQKKDMYSVSFSLDNLRSSNLLTQLNFDRLMAHSEILLSDSRLWSRIPDRSLTEDLFQQMIALAIQHQDNPETGRTAFAAFVNRRILGIAPGDIHDLNHGQSTHTESVHQSVSESAKKLWQAYGHKLTTEKQLENIHQEISKWIATLSDEMPQQKAAKRCFARLTAGYRLDFIDPKSQVSIRQLLALSWLAMKDKLPDDNEKEGFVTGLYEVQRAYNLSDTGVDDGQEDNPSCSSGAFNRLMQALCGIHPGVSILFITKEAANIKFPTLIHREIETYLNHLATKSLTDEEITELKNIENGEISDNLWASISKSIADELWEEFQSAYKNKRQTFDDMIAQGIYAPLSDANKALASRLLLTLTTSSSSSNSSAFFRPGHGSLEQDHAVKDGKTFTLGS